MRYFHKILWFYPLTHIFIEYFFKMPVQLAIYYANNQQRMLKTVQLNEKTNTFTIAMDSEPADVLVDPNSWVLMQVKMLKK